MRKAIVIIDMQNDFIRKEGSLCVANGDKAAANVAKFLRSNQVDDIFVSMDYHPKKNISSTEFWYIDENTHVEPFTNITYDDVFKNKVKSHFYKAYLLDYLDELERKGKELIAWPPHCVQDTWGCEVCDEIKDVLKDKENVEYIKKGTNPYTEHYSIFKAEVPVANASLTGYIYLPYDLSLTDVPVISNYSNEASSKDIYANVKEVNREYYAEIKTEKKDFKKEINETTLNSELLDKLNEYDKVYVCGVATDFCVKESLKDIMEYKPELCPKLVILTECMASISDSDVVGEDDIYKTLLEKGAKYI